MKKKRRKRLVSVLLVSTLVIAMTACGNTTEEAPAETPMGEAPVDEIGEYQWVLGTDSPEDTVTHLFAVKFGELLGEYSGGKISLQIFPNATLGGDADLIQYVKNQDAVQFVVQTTAPQVTYMPKLAVFDTPCPYPDINGVRAALDDEAFMDTIAGIYDEAGYHLLGYADQVFRIMSSNIKVETLEQFKGIKIRTMENSNHMAFWQMLKANPTPMAFSEVYTSLQNGTIDAQENPYEVIVGNKLYEQQKYIIQTNHLPHLLCLMTGKSLYDGLNDAEKAIVDQAAEAAKVYARQQADDRVADRVSIIEAEGSEIVPISAELYAQIVAAAQPVYEDIKSQVGEDLFNAYIK